MKNEGNWKREDLGAKNLILFFIIAFAWTWIFWSPFILNILQLPAGTGTSNVNLGDIGLILPIILASPFGPTIAAFLMSYRNEGREGISQLWKQFRDSKPTNTWLVITLVFYPTIFLFLRLSSAIIFSVPQPTPVWIENPLIMLAPFAASTLHGGLSEEFGWRGYALPRLQSKFNATQASIILGLIEGLWHVPLVFWVGDARYGMSIPLLILWQMIATFYRTWIFNNTDGSILAAVLFHAMGNTASDIAPINLPSFPWLPRFKFVPLSLLIVFAAIVFSILAVFGSENMIRKSKPEPQLPSN
jgi:membrane protease YdiL (CAAX protease family)